MSATLAPSLIQSARYRCGPLVHGRTRLLVRAVALIPSGKKGRRRGGVYRLLPRWAVNRCVVIAAKHQGSSAGIWAQEWRIRALVLCRRIGALASDDIPCFGCKPRPLRGGPGGTMLARHRIHLRALEPGKGLGKVRRESGRGYGSFGSEGATRLPSLLFAQVWGRGERGRLHWRQRSGGNDWGRALDTEEGLDPGPCRGPGAEQ